MLKLLPKDVANDIKKLLSDMVNPVSLVLFTDDSCNTCLETRQLLEDVSTLNDKIRLVVKDFHKDLDDVQKYGIERIPSFVILAENGAYKGVKFNGIPAGHEINSFLAALVVMSGHGYIIEDALLERIHKITKPVDIKVFVTLSCPHCPGAVQTAHLLAMQNPNIKGEMIESQTFPELSKKYHVSGVPKIVINDTVEILGDQPIENFLDAIEKL